MLYQAPLDLSLSSFCLFFHAAPLLLFLLLIIKTFSSAELMSWLPVSSEKNSGIICGAIGPVVAHLSAILISGIRK